MKPIPQLIASVTVLFLDTETILTQCYEKAYYFSF